MCMAISSMKKRQSFLFSNRHLTNFCLRKKRAACCGCNDLRATSHTRLRAHDHYTSSTLIGGKGRVGPSSLHTTLEGPMEYVNARWMYNLHGLLHGIKWIMFSWSFGNHLLE